MAITSPQDDDNFIHGLKSKDRALGVRVIWALLTITSFGALSYHLYTLIFRFNLQPVTVQTSDAEFSWPDIHLCPQFSFSDSRIRSLARKNDKKWTEIEKVLRQLETSVFYLNTSMLNRTVILLHAFWETLDPSLLHASLSLPKYENLILFKVNDIRKFSY